MKRRVLSFLIIFCMMLSVSVSWVSATNMDNNSYTDIENFAHSYANNLYISFHKGHYPVCDTCGYYAESSLEMHFDKNGDSLCDICQYYLCTTHIYTGEYFYCTADNHYDVCKFCDYYNEGNPNPHFSNDGDRQCDICYYNMSIPGDIDFNLSVDNQDVEYLLWHTLFPEDYPVSPELGDLDSNGAIDNLDVEYLLWHTLFPEDYPI